jgi:predicted ATP-dependent endonuclease of OLD family
VTLRGATVRISRLQIEGFRSIKSIDVQLPQVCALVGPNNAGKSNILEAIKRVLGSEYGPRTASFTEEDVHHRDPDGKIEICLTFDRPIEYRKLQKADPIGIDTLKFCWTRYKVGPQKGQRRLEQACLREDGRVPSVQTSYGKPGQRPNFEPVVSVPSEVRDQIPFIHIGIDRSLKEQLPNARWSLLRRIFEDINRGLKAPGQSVERPSADGPPELVGRVDRFRALMAEAMELLRTDDFKELEASIKKHALEQLGLDDEGGAIDLYFTPMETMDFYKSLDLVVREGDFSISAKEMGGGMQNAIVLAVLRAFEETRRQGAIILIEEPEMFLHPQMQRSLFSAIERLGETNQVIYTTHSPHFVSVPDYRNVAVVRKDPELGTVVAQSRLDATESRLEKLRQSIDSERGELFFAKRVLVVEGATEKMVIPAFARREGIDLDASGGTVVEAGGKRALMEFAELAISFGIPTGIVYDRDTGSGERAEAEYNARLNQLATADGAVKVWCLDPDYETAARAHVGEAKYQEVMDRYPTSVYGKGKARRARMAATDAEFPPPPPLLEAIKWLGAAKRKPSRECQLGTAEDREWEAAAPG